MSKSQLLLAWILCRSWCYIYFCPQVFLLIETWGKYMNFFPLTTYLPTFYLVAFSFCLSPFSLTLSLSHSIYSTVPDWHLYTLIFSQKNPPYMLLLDAYMLIQKLSNRRICTTKNDWTGKNPQVLTFWTTLIQT